MKFPDSNSSNPILYFIPKSSVISLSNRQKELQTLEAEKTRLEQSIAASKTKFYPPKTQDRKKKQSGNDREINKRPRSDPIDEEASIERDLFGGIRHHRFWTLQQFLHPTKLL